MTTQFQKRAKPNDPNGHLTVQYNLEYLRDVFDKYQAKGAFGSATVPNGSTTVVVTHSLGSPTYAANISPTVDPGVGVRYWISNKTSTQFTINLSAAAGIGGVSFDWSVKGA